MRVFRAWIPADMRAYAALQRSRALVLPPAVLRSAARIVGDVRRRGDAAVLAAVRRFDGVRLTRRTLRVAPAAIRRAWIGLPPADRRAMRVAWRNIVSFHLRQRERGYVMRTPYGVLEHVIRPLGRVGIHVPAGTAPLVSTMLMCAGAARAAGVRDLVLAVPPRWRGGVHPAVLAGAFLAGIDEVYAAGGPAGVAMLAYGTETVPAVDKVVGPGNLYTQAAEMLVQSGAGLMGPSELVVLADGSAAPAAVAADLLAQAEHAGDNWAVLVTPSRVLGAAVMAEVVRQVIRLPRAAVAARSLAGRSAVVLVRSMAAGLGVAERFAPEHLEIVGRGAEGIAARVRCAGTVLVGPWSPVAAADYGAGPNHVLPTSGMARHVSGLGVKDFVKHMNITRLTARGLGRLAPPLARLARLEGLEGHARSMEMNRG
ncbi:MAG: histidinol dehydrogenase [Candidatus Coatesbacteria bacterium]